MKVTGVEVASEGTKISLNATLAKEHYGSLTTIARTNAPGSMALDARAGVGLLTRNIKVTVTDTDTDHYDRWGCRILVSSAPDIATGAITRGKLVLNSVEVAGCGQEDSLMAGIRLQGLGQHKANTPDLNPTILPGDPRYPRYSTTGDWDSTY